MASNTQETNYKALKNRCPRCGHRLSQKAALTNTCTNESGDGKIPETVTHCPCRKHRRP